MLVNNSSSSVAEFTSEKYTFSFIEPHFQKTWAKFVSANKSLLDLKILEKKTWKPAHKLAKPSSWLSLAWTEKDAVLDEKKSAAKCR